MADQVLEGLRCACSQSPEEIKFAEAKQKEWQVVPGFYETLAEIFTNLNVEENYRLMALIWIKLGIQRYWRPSLPNAIPGPEKEKVKQALLQGYSASSKKSAKQVAEAMCRIVCVESLDQWPQLAPTLMEGVQSSDSGLQEKSLLMLSHVIKGLSSRMLLTQKKIFENFTSQIFETLLNLWLGTMTVFLQGIQDGRQSEELLHHLDKAVLALKIVKKLCLFGFMRPCENLLCNQFFQNLFPRVDDLLKCRVYVKSQKPEYVETLLEPLEKYIVRHMKLVYEFQDKFIGDFVQHAPTVIEFAFNHLFGKDMELIVTSNRLNFPWFGIHCFNIIKSQLGYDDSVPRYDRSLDVKYVKVTDGFFDSQKVTLTIERLINVYLPLSPGELSLWADDPEEYMNDEVGDSWKYTLRGSTEAFFKIICRCYEREMSSCMLELIYTVQRMPLNSMEAILFKEAVYNATGLATFRLFDSIDTDFTVSLLGELQQQCSQEGMHILKRRTLWLIGKWTSVQDAKSLRPQVYAACTELMQEREDVVVRLTAAQTLKSVMQDFDFEPEQLLPYLETVFQRLYSILVDACEVDTKMNILKTMSFIIEKMSLNIEKHANTFVSYLPQLWLENSDNCMLKTVILSTMREIIQAFQRIPETLLPFIYSIVDSSTNIADPSHVYLIDEGLEVWLKAIHYSKEPNQELITHATRLLPIIESSSTYLLTCLHIMQGYILLTPDFFVQNFGPTIVSSFRVMSEDIRTEGIVNIQNLYILMLKTLPAVAIPILRPVFLDAFKTVYEDESLLSTTRSALLLICRLLVIDRAAFIEVIQGLEKPDALEVVVQAMLDKTNCTQKEDMKLVSLALLSIITEPSQIVYLNFSAILDKLHRAMIHIVREDPQDPSVKTDCLVIDSDYLEEFLSYEEMLHAEALDTTTPHYQRLQQVGLRDPIHTIHLDQLFQNQINQIKSTLGEENYRQLLSSQDIEILKKVNEFIDLGIPELRQLKSDEASMI